MNSTHSKITQHLKKNPWYEGSFELFEYGNFPAECPWNEFLEQNQKEFVHKIFQPLESSIPNTVRNLIESCKDVFALLADNEWFLIYVINEDVFLCGGEPNVSPVLSNDVINDGWKLPVELKTFYKIHNGFGYLWYLGMFWISDCIVPDYKLETLNALFTSLLEHEPDIILDFDPKSILQFFYNGAGDAQCFYKTEDKEVTTFFWDHETRELYHPDDFWSFVDENLSELFR